MSGMISDRDKMTLDTIRKEIIALKMLRHPNIVRLFDVKKLNKVIFMIMELCNGGVIILLLSFRH
jgi:serine/threonine-protein kinase ULK/ATG1